MECRHAYGRPLGIAFLWFCYQCDKYYLRLPSGSEAVRPEEIDLPPVIFNITERLWKMRSPWPKVPFNVVKHYGWYISMLFSRDHLVMPIHRNGKPVFYSARCLEPNCKHEDHSKCYYPKGVKKAYWISSEGLSKGIGKRIFKSVLVEEGIPDAAYVSLIAPSIALLGIYYDGSEDELLRDRDVVLLLDGDRAGIAAAAKMQKRFPTAKGIQRFILPNGCDPTDVDLEWLVTELKQIGVE